MSEQIAVIGAGSGGISFAIHLAMKGKEVIIYDNDKSKIEKLKKKHVIKVSGLYNLEMDSLKFTENIEEAISKAKLILVSITTNNIKNLANEISPFISSNQIIIFNPGHTFGAIEFVYNLKRNGVKNLPIVAETQDLIFACRLDNNYNLKINGIKKSMDIATYNPKDIKKVLSILSKYFRVFNPVENTWITSLNNISSMIHPIPTLLNISRIEDLKTFRYYREGITQTISDIIELADKERLAIGKALDIDLTSTLNWMKASYDTDGETIYECIENNKTYDEILGPNNIEHRFIFEDIMSGLVPMASMGAKLNIETPTLNTFIDLGNLVNKRNYREEGRTLKKISLDNIEVNDIKNYFSNKN